MSTAARSALDANRLGALWATLDRLMDAALPGQSRSSAAILLTLRHRAPINQIDLAAVVDLSQPACSRAVARLVEQGVVACRSGTGKAVELRLSAAGRRQADAMALRRLQALGGLLGILSHTERAALNAIVDKLVAPPVSGHAYAHQVCRFCDHGICDGPACPIGGAARVIAAASAADGATLANRAVRSRSARAPSRPR